MIEAIDFDLGPAQNLSRRFRISVKTSTGAAFGIPRCTAISGTWARRNGFVARSRLRDEGTVGDPAARANFVASRLEISAAFSGSIVRANLALVDVYS